MADTNTGVGGSVRRKEDHRFITGKGNYTDDINLKDQTYAYFLRSPHAHARIKGIDARAAGASSLSIGEGCPSRCTKTSTIRSISPTTRNCWS